MISMTGYGRGEVRQGRLAVALEVKTVNHRHFDAQVKLPGVLLELEAVIKKKLQQEIARGRAEVYLHLLSPLAGTREPVVDMELAAKYLKAFKQIGQRLGLPGKPELAQIIRMPDVVRVEQRPVATNVINTLVKKSLDLALGRLKRMRQAEGRRLATDIQQRLEQIRLTVQKIKILMQTGQKQQEKRLSKKISAWLKTDDAEGKRLAQEAVSKQIKSDVTEEIVRLGSHVKHFNLSMKSQEPVGRRLDFLIQEMNREMNTIGSKAADTKIAHLVVSMKEELEKIREQIQNIE